MLDSLDGESGDGDVAVEGDSIESPMGAEMPMESVILSKEQVGKLNETFNNLETDKDEVNIEKQKTSKAKNTPFNNPNFQK